MLVGNGLIASAFKSTIFENDSNIILFASGVSNSKEENPDAFVREKNLLINNLSLGKPVYYISTCSINDPEMQNTGYVTHKKAMESLVKESSSNAIFRLPQVVGKTANPNTLTNFLYSKIISDTPFQIWKHAKRNLIDVDDVVQIACALMNSSMAHGTINIASPFDVSILEIVKSFETVLNKKANYELVDAGGVYPIEINQVRQIESQLNIIFDGQYITNLLRKYYS